MSTEPVAQRGFNEVREIAIFPQSASTNRSEQLRIDAHANGGFQVSSPKTQDRAHPI